VSLLKDKAVADIGMNVTGLNTGISRLDGLDRLYRAVARKGKIGVIFAGAGPRRKDGDYRSNARSFRQELQHQCPRHLFHRSKGAAPLE